MDFGGRHYDEWQFTTKTSRMPNFRLRKLVALLIFNPQKGPTFTPVTLVTFAQAPHSELTPPRTYAGRILGVVETPDIS